MMNNIMQINNNQVASMSTEQLIDELRQAVQVTAVHLVHLAAIWRELESRGVDLSGFRTGLMAYLPAIASGSVIPDVIIKFAGNSRLLSKIGKLPENEQQRLIEYDTISVVTADGIIEKSLPLLTSKDLAVVFSDAGMRTPEEQQKYLEIVSNARLPDKKKNNPLVRIDHVDRVLKIGNTKADLDEVLLVLKNSGYKISKK